MTWQSVRLYGSVGVERLAAEYSVNDMRMPNTKYRVKVFENVRGNFVAHPNIQFRLPDGAVDGTCGIAKTEVEALQDCIKNVDEILSSRAAWSDDDIVWSDPADF